MSLEIEKGGVSELTTDAVPDSIRDSIKTGSELNVSDINDSEDAKRDVTSELNSSEPKTATEANADQSTSRPRPNQPNVSKPKKKTTRNKDGTARLPSQGMTGSNYLALHSGY